MPELPLEVIERIIDAVADDMPTEPMPAGYTLEVTECLWTCAQTCRAWLPRSRYHLFQKLAIDSRRRLDAIVQTSKTPHLRALYPFVTSLSLGEGDTPEVPAWIHLSAITLAGMFRNVSNLNISLIDWKQASLHSSVLRAGFPLFTKVTKLSLYHCFFGSFNQFQHLVCAFPSLRDLTLTCIQCADIDALCAATDRQVQVPPHLAKPQLHTVNFIDWSALGKFADSIKFLSPLAFWLVRTQSVDTLRTSLRIELHTPAHHEIVGRAVRTLADTLDTYAAIEHGDEDPEMNRYISFGNCAHLQDLRLSVWYTYDLRDTLTTVLPTLLGTLPRENRLRKFQIEFWIQTKNDIGLKELQDWKYVDAVLAQAHFRALEFVEVVIYVNMDRSALSGAEARAELEVASAGMIRRGVQFELRWFKHLPNAHTFVKPE